MKLFLPESVILKMSLIGIILLSYIQTEFSGFQQSQFQDRSQECCLFLKVKMMISLHCMKYNLKWKLANYQKKKERPFCKFWYHGIWILKFTLHIILLFRRGVKCMANGINMMVVRTFTGTLYTQQRSYTQLPMQWRGRPISQDGHVHN